MNIVDKNADISSFDYREGAIILIDKPIDWSSFSVVNKIRWVLRHHYGIKKIKVGHGGTLDPLATGLLIVFTGLYTKKIENYMGLDKSYNCTIKLGAQTASYDAETPEENIKSADHISLKEVETALEGFRGTQQQLAPVYSALKVKGQPMYKLARKGQVVERKSREITIHDIQLISFDSPFINLNLHCSKGSYVRSFAHDIGEVLDTGGYLTQLRRSAIGEFKIENAIKIDDFVNAMKSI